MERIIFNWETGKMSEKWLGWEELTTVTGVWDGDGENGWVLKWVPNLPSHLPWLVKEPPLNLIYDHCFFDGILIQGDQTQVAKSIRLFPQLLISQGNMKIDYFANLLTIFYVKSIHDWYQNPKNTWCFQSLFKEKKSTE